MLNHKVIILLVLLLSGSCSFQKDAEKESITDKPVIAVTNYPLYYFARTIAGDFIEVNFPLIDGDPAFWMPSAEQLHVFQHADLIIINGAGYEQWIERVSLPSSKIVNTSIEFKNQWIETHDGIKHSHGKEGAHVHQGTAFTTWLNFKFAIQQAESIYLAIARLAPEHKVQFDQNYKQLKSDLMDLDQKMSVCGSQLAGKQIITSHPVYQYLQSGYGLDLASLHWEPNEMPSDGQWEELKLLIQNQKSVIMVWEEKPISAIGSVLDSLKIKYLVFDPCANEPTPGNFMDIMRQNVSQLENAKAKE